ncbi:MAG: CPBP family intramembrane glutamic endopeptidase [Pseudomonadota bacterium]
MSTSFNTPPALGREPWSVFFWTLCAPFLFPVLVMTLAGAFVSFEGVMSQDNPSREQLGAVWLVVCIGSTLQFAALSIWSNHIGAGPFAGSMTATFNWITAALVLGPLLLIVPSVIVSAIMAGQEDWQFSGEVNRAVFQMENWTLAYIVYGVLIAPVLEEVTFRGVALGALISRGISPYAAAVLSSAAFAFIHLQYSPAAMAVVFVTGLGFAALRLLSGSILVPILAHMAANGNMFLLQTLAPSAGG